MGVEKTIQGRFDFGIEEPETLEETEDLSEGVEFKRGSIHLVIVGVTPIRDYLNNMGQEWILELKDLIMESDLSPFYKSYRKTGRRAIHPCLMLGLIVYGLLKGVKSLRSLEHLSKMDIGSWWLTDGIQPDHSTIGKFIQQHSEVLGTDYFSSLTGIIIQKLKVNVQEVACDGTIVESVGSRYKELKREALLETLDQSTDDKERKVLSKAMDVCEERDEVRARRGKKDGVKVCYTDHEAVVQKDKISGYRASYKPSVLATENRIITGISVHPSSENAVIPRLLEQHIKITGNLPETLMGDAGYCTLENIELCKREEIDFLATNGKDGQTRKGSTGKFHKSKFRYDESEDIVTCPSGYKMVVKERTTDEFGRYYTKYRCKDLKRCAFSEECTHSKKERTIKRYVGDDVKDTHLAKMETDDNKERLRQRKAFVEPVFSELKGSFNLRRFTRYGLKGASVEIALFGLAYNFKRYLRLKKPLPVKIAGKCSEIVDKCFNMRFIKKVSLKIFMVFRNEPC